MVVANKSSHHELERALEGLFRLGANRRFDTRQAAEVGAVVTRAGYAVLRSLHDGGTLSLREVAEAESPRIARVLQYAGVAIVAIGIVVIVAGWTVAPGQS